MTIHLLAGDRQCDFVVGLRRLGLLTITFGIWRVGANNVSRYVTMKHLFKIIKHKKPSRPFQQPNAVGDLPAVAAGPPLFRAERDAVSDGG